MAIVGIDLGTTNSAVASMWMGRPEIIPNYYGARTTPSVVGLSKNHKILVGQKAKHQRVTLLAPPIEEIKRKMGENVTVPMGERQYSPEHISSFILQRLKYDAEQFLEERVECAVITIPAYFNESARRATRDAGEIAGLHVGMIIDEPTSSALAYGMRGDKDEVVMVYDLGGGTFDVSIIEIAGNHFEVLAIDGNIRLGGRDFDRVLIDYVCQEIKSRYGINLNKDAQAMAKLSVAAEATKCDLSYWMDSSVLVQAITDDIDVNVDIKRELLEELVRPLVNSTLIPVERALQKADLEADEIDEVVLVGGMTRMPMVRETVKDFFGRPPRCDLNPDECVALGAAIYTQLLDENTKRTFGASWAQVGDREKENLVVVPRTAHALGIGVDEGGSKFSVILPSGSFYPVSITRKDYYTAMADQTGIEFWVYEGENPSAHKNTPLGLVRLDLPEGLPAGLPIWITFALNDSRILEVTVQLPDRPELKVQVRIEAKGHSSQEITLLLQHQLDAIGQLLDRYKVRIDQSRHAEITWGLNSIRDLLEQGNATLAQEKLRLLEHVHDELLMLEKNERI